MGDWEYCHVLQFPDDSGTFFFQEGEDDASAKKSGEQNAPNGRQVIDELARNGWETISVSAVRDDASGGQKKPVYKWILKRPGAQTQWSPRIGTD